MAAYQSLITQSMYDKQLDSGKGTLLHLCNDVIEQEVGVIQQKGFCLERISFLFFFPWIHVKLQFAGQRGDSFLLYSDGTREGNN